LQRFLPGNFLGEDMNSHNALAIGAALLIPLAAFADRGFTSLHPEEAHPNSTEQPSPGPYSDFYRRVQQRLHAEGFDAGPVNGDFGSKTQAALAQFQLSRALPAGGQLDTETLAALGVERSAHALPSGSPTAEADRSAPDRVLEGSCDALAGPEKIACVQQGGTVEASAKSSTGASGPASSK
jgi:hypothetical protein